MLAVFLFVNIFFLAIALLRERNTVIQFFWIMLLGISLLISIKWFQAITNNSHIAPLYFMVLSNFSAILTSSLYNRREKKPLLVLPKKSKKYFSLVSLIFFISALVFIVGAGKWNASIFLQSWDKMCVAIESEDILRNSAVLCYLGGLGAVRCAIRQGASRLVLSVIFVFAFLFVVILRSKIFIFPLILAFTLFDKERQKDSPMINLGVLVLLLVSGYFVVMFVRWLGDFTEVSQLWVGSVANGVWNSGIEQHLFNQYTEIFNYFESNDFLIGDTYIRIVVHPLSFLFSELIAPENPIYLYYTIMSSEIGVMTGSAHPTIYGDSYANFGWFGLFVLPIIYLGVVNLSTCYAVRDFFYDMRYVGIFTGLPLILRGSVYYGIFYILICIFIGITTKLFFSKFFRYKRVL